MNNLGKEGEDKAERFLKGLGFKILERSYSCPMGEVDIIALEGNTLVFVEVKTRSTYAFGGSVSAVTPKKQAKITKTALSFIKFKNLKPEEIRFDVAAITGDSPPLLIRNAFTPRRYTF